MSSSKATQFRLRSYVIRGSRGTIGQDRAISENWPTYGLERSNGKLDYGNVFGNAAPTYLEIGFGSGQSLLSAAETHRDKNFIGVETHRPGVGALLLGMRARELENIRVFRADVIDVLNDCIAGHSLDGVQIFFPDPWQKRRHHARRLVQADFLKLLATKIKPGGSLHLATDWEDYAKHMMRVVSAAPNYENQAGFGQFGKRSIYRPTISKFEQRALNEGRAIWEIQLVRQQVVR